MAEKTDNLIRDKETDDFIAEFGWEKIRRTGKRNYRDVRDDLAGHRMSQGRLFYITQVEAAEVLREITNPLGAPGPHDDYKVIREKGSCPYLIRGAMFDYKVLSPADLAALEKEPDRYPKAGEARKALEEARRGPDGKPDLSCTPMF